MDLTLWLDKADLLSISLSEDKSREGESKVFLGGSSLEAALTSLVSPLFYGASSLMPKWGQRCSAVDKERLGELKTETGSAWKRRA